MTTPPRTYTLTDQQVLLIREGLTMLAAQRHARRSVGAKNEHSGRASQSRIRRFSKETMEMDSLKELTQLRAMFRGDSYGMGTRDSADGERPGGSDAGA